MKLSEKDIKKTLGIQGSGKALFLDTELAAKISVFAACEDRRQALAGIYLSEYTIEIFGIWGVRMDLREFYFQNIQEAEYHHRFYDSITNVNKIYNIKVHQEEVTWATYERDKAARLGLSIGSSLWESCYRP